MHGDAGSWISYGVDGQERRLIAALTPDAVDAPSDDERAVSIDGISGTEREMPIARGDYRQFYVELAAAVRGAASNPVPLDQALAVVAVGRDRDPIVSRTARA